MKLIQNNPKQVSKSISAVALILVNLIPLFGVWFWGWNILAILIVYWLESVIIGFFNVLRLLKSEKNEPWQKPILAQKVDFGIDFSQIPWEDKKETIKMFLANFGIFVLIDGFFVFFFVLVFNLQPLVWWIILVNFLGLFISHLISHLVNFIGNQEYKRVSLQQLFFQPYKRILVMHITIIVGTFLILRFGLPVNLAFSILIVLKIVIDLWSHIAEHRSFSEA